jgi:transcriptional regulator of acetoin/glycerol metabolism
MTDPKRHQLQHAAFDDPDLVDRIFEYLIERFPEISASAEQLREAKADVRAEFAGENVWVANKSQAELARERKVRAQRILALFNGENATQIARQLNVHRTTVYRTLKQAGKA